MRWNEIFEDQPNLQPGDHVAVFIVKGGKWVMHMDCGTDHTLAFGEKKYINDGGGNAEVFKKK